MRLGFLFITAIVVLLVLTGVAVLVGARLGARRR
jgi:hypothetical protein